MLKGDEHASAISRCRTHMRPAAFCVCVLQQKNAHTLVPGALEVSRKTRGRTVLSRLRPQACAGALP